MKKEGLKTNFIFQTLYQVLILVIPLVISPYLTRVLGSENLGAYTYTNSIVYYFVIIANLGIAKHGQRIISTNRDDEVKLRKSFWSLFYLHLFSSFVSILGFISIVLFIGGAEKTLYLIQILYLASALFDITWLFYGLENFKSVVIKNAIIKIIECVLIFVFVKSKEDLFLYTWIMSGSILLGQVILVPQAIKLVKPIRVLWEDIAFHIKPMLVLFVSVVASTLYTVFDKTLLGIFAEKSSVAFYEYANKIINIPKQIIFVIGTVMFPRACKAYNEGNYSLQSKYIDYSMFFTCFLGSAFCFGLMAIGRKFSIIYYGEEFSESGNMIMAMAPLIIIVMIGEIVRSEFLIPAGKDFLYTINIVISALINIVLSLFLIQFFGAYGVIIGTTIAETFGMIFQIICCRKIYPIKKLMKVSLPFFASGLIMFVSVFYISTKTSISILWLLIEIIIGAAIYFILFIILKATIYKEYKLGVLKRKNPNE